MTRLPRQPGQVIDPSQKVSFSFDGKKIEALAGDLHCHLSELPLRGVTHRVVHRATRGTVWTEPGEDIPLLCVAGDRSHLARRLRDYLKREAKRDLEAASRHYAEELGVTVRRIGKALTTRLGKCGVCRCRSPGGD